MDPAAIYTIGVHGFTEESFFAALVENGIRTLIDVRRRRGVRGADLAFANSKRLQVSLASMDVQYIHLVNYAPTIQTMKSEHKFALEAGVPLRSRSGLSTVFIESYESEVLQEFSTSSFMSLLPENPNPFVLLCVEELPGACHRSLLAERLALDLGMAVIHLQP